MEEQKQRSITSEWMSRHSDLYKSAIRAPFILGIRDGSLPLKSYNRWLEQDYLFVKAFVRFIASILCKAPNSASDDEVDLLLGGLNALQQELAWFRSQASKLKLNLDKTAAQDTTRRYCEFLAQLSAPDVEYPVALTTLWIIEAVYNESFATCLEDGAKTAPEFQEACQRWGNEEFRGYCMALKARTDEVLERAFPGSLREAEKHFERVLALEVDFWSMSFE